MLTANVSAVTVCTSDRIFGDITITIRSVAEVPQMGRAPEGYLVACLRFLFNLWSSTKNCSEGKASKSSCKAESLLILVLLPHSVKHLDRFCNRGQGRLRHRGKVLQLAEVKQVPDVEKVVALGKRAGQVATSTKQATSPLRPGLGTRRVACERGLRSVIDERQRL